MEPLVVPKGPRGEKRPGDVIGAAIMVAKIATGEVEDNAAALRLLAEEAALQADAVTAAEKALTLARDRYQGGITTYLEVVTAQNTALINERVSVEIATRRMTAAVNLVKALGGGWRATDLPN